MVVAATVLLMIVSTALFLHSIKRRIAELQELNDTFNRLRDDNENLLARLEELDDA